MKPGKPLAFGQIDNAVFFGLPGNPVSVFVTFYQVVRPALLRMMGASMGKKVRLRARCTSAITKIPGRQEFQRGTLEWTEHGKPPSCPRASSNRTTSARWPQATVSSFFRLILTAQRQAIRSRSNRLMLLPLQLSRNARSGQTEPDIPHST